MIPAAVHLQVRPDTRDGVTGGTQAPLSATDPTSGGSFIDSYGHQPPGITSLSEAEQVDGPREAQSRHRPAVLIRRACGSTGRMSPACHWFQISLPVMSPLASKPIGRGCLELVAAQLPQRLQPF
jgi:hypothetical protein